MGFAVRFDDNFRKLRGWGWKELKDKTLLRQDKGEQSCCAAFIAAIEGTTGLAIPIDEIFEVADVTLKAAAQLRALEQLRKQVKRR